MSSLTHSNSKIVRRREILASYSLSIPHFPFTTYLRNESSDRLVSLNGSLEKARIFFKPARRGLLVSRAKTRGQKPQKPAIITGEQKTVLVDLKTCFRVV